MNFSATTANASLTSQMSMSSVDSPALAEHLPRRRHGRVEHQRRVVADVGGGDDPGRAAPAVRFGVLVGWRSRMAAAPSTTPELLPAWCTCSIFEVGELRVDQLLVRRALLVERELVEAGERRLQRLRALQRGVRAGVLLVVEDHGAVVVDDRHEAACRTVPRRSRSPPGAATRRPARRAPRGGCPPAWRWHRRRRPGVVCGWMARRWALPASMNGPACRRARLAAKLDIISVPPAMTTSSRPDMIMPAARFDDGDAAAAEAVERHAAGPDVVAGVERRHPAEVAALRVRLVARAPDDVVDRRRCRGRCARRSPRARWRRGAAGGGAPSAPLPTLPIPRGVRTGIDDPGFAHDRPSTRWKRRTLSTRTAFTVSVTTRHLAVSDISDVRPCCGRPTVYCTDRSNEDSRVGSRCRNESRYRVRSPGRVTSAGGVSCSPAQGAGSASCSPTPSPMPGRRWRWSPAPRATLKEVAAALPGPALVFCRRRARRRLQRRRGRRDGRRVGRRRRLDLQRRDLARRRRSAAHRPGGLARGHRRQPDRGVPRRPCGGTGDGPGRPPDLHRLRARRTARRRASPPTAPPRPASSAWPRRWRSTSPRPGITVNVVAPGWFDSPLADGWTNNERLSAADPRPHGARAGGGSPPISPAPFSSSRRTPRRSSPGPCSTVDGGYLLV